MKQTLKVPIEGSTVRRETTYPVATGNGYETVGAAPPPMTTPEAPEAPATPAVGATPVERLINSNNGAHSSNTSSSERATDSS